MEKENVDKVQVDDDKITYTLKGSEQLYETAKMEDPELVEPA